MYFLVPKVKKEMSKLSKHLWVFIFPQSCGPAPDSRPIPFLTVLQVIKKKRFNSIFFKTDFHSSCKEIQSCLIAAC